MDLKEATELAKKYVNLNECKTCVVTSNGDVYKDTPLEHIKFAYLGRDVNFIAVKGIEVKAEKVEETKPEIKIEDKPKKERNK